MGQTYSGLRNYFFSNPEKNILIYGLSSVGKTAVFNKMQLDEQVYPTPNPDICEGKLNLKGYIFYLVDISSHLTSKYSGVYFMEKCDAVIFVVDSTDCDSLNEVNKILDDMMSSELLKNAIYLVYANKQDLSNALTPTQISEKLRLSETKPFSRVQGSSGLTGEGVREGLEFLHLSFSKRKWFSF